ncbi:NAD(P)-dependent oxidoreductase [Halomonas sp. TRM85114]|uniref:NAD(P)-dependent oxidoreductase n=1 Tax=Halomonas jincaotanensis TaxID=2810616 RepID=UPI001BD28E4C|nr:NAD(P)-dependent oxidoreductase [Halomonas jincaotanensis]MBS9402356.1 NAD(P)-dependent oxidoreductase [Halomonas jincaotanensis]
MKQERIGFIGLGLMGKEMAGHIVRNGYPLAVMAHRNRSPLEALCAEGATEVSSAAEMARNSDIVFICVKTSEQVSEIVAGAKGLLAGGHEGLIIVDCSTVHPESTERLAETVSQQGAVLVDAPLARTPREAREGRLNAMLGGDAATVARITPVIESFAENIFPIGKVGSAHKLKLINNFLSLGAAALVSEAATMAAGMNVPQDKLLEICSQGGANSAMLAPVMEWVLQGECTKLQFSLGNAEKDMRYLAETLSAYQLRSNMLPPLCEFLTQARSDIGEDSFVPQAYDSCTQRNDIAPSRG